MTLLDAPRAGSVLAGGRGRGRHHAFDAGGADPARGWKLVVLGAIVLAIASLLLPSEPTYDPWAWIIWSREVTEGALSTTSGPSWKPLPVLLVTPFALLGDDIAVAAWLVTARAGGLLAVVMALRLGARLAGPVAGVIAGVALLFADEFVRNFARGNSEGLLVALVLFAVERHLDGRRGSAFALGLAAAMLRPEVWPFIGLYGLWLGWREPWHRGLVAGSLVALVVLWFGAEWWGSGNPLRASDRARQPNPGSAAFADHPFLEVFARSWHVLVFPVLLGAAIGLASAVHDALRRGGGGLRIAFGAGAAVLMIMVAAMTQVGYAGNLRYVALPAALLCALAGAGWVDVVRAVGRRWGQGAGATAVALILAATVPFVVHEAGTFAKDMRLVRAEAALYRDLDNAVAAAGGAARARSCGAIYTGNFDTTALAWRLHVPLERAEIVPYGPGIVFAARRFSLTRPQPSVLSRDRRYRLVAGTRRWVVRARCGPAAPRRVLPRPRQD